MGDGLLAVILLLVVGGWIITRVAKSAARKAARAGEHQIARLTTRVFTLEQDRASLDALNARVAALEQQLQAPREPVKAPSPEPVPVAAAPEVSEPAPPAEPPPLPVSPPEACGRAHRRLPARSRSRRKLEKRSRSRSHSGCQLAEQAGRHRACVRHCVFPGLSVADPRTRRKSAGGLRRQRRHARRRPPSRKTRALSYLRPRSRRRWVGVDVLHHLRDVSRPRRARSRLAGARPGVDADRLGGHGGPHSALPLPSRHGPGFPAGVLHRHYQPCERVQPRGQRRPRSGTCGHRVAHALVRDGTVRHRRHVRQSLCVAAPHHRAHGQEPPSVSGIFRQRRITRFLLGGLPYFLSRSAHRRRPVGKRLDNRRAPEQPAPVGPDEVPVDLSRAGLLVPPGIRGPRDGARLYAGPPGGAARHS